MEFSQITVKERYSGQVLEIVLNMPPANILSAKMIGEISSVLEEGTRNPHAKLFLFQGEGKHFCFGASVEEHKVESVGSMLPLFHRLIGQILNNEVPTLAQVSGYCLGGGFELALASTFLFADKKAVFAVPEIELGVFPPVAAALLPLMGTPASTGEMILTGRKYPAEALAVTGLVNEVTEEGKLEEIVTGFIEKRILTKSASSLRYANKAMRLPVAERFQQLIGKLEDKYLNGLMKTKDAVEGIQSFLEKRAPKWVDA